MIVYAKEDKFGYKQIADKIKDQYHVLERTHLSVEEMKTLIDKYTQREDNKDKTIESIQQEIERINYTLQILAKQQTEILMRLNSDTQQVPQHQTSFETKQPVNYIPLKGE